MASTQVEWARTLLAGGAPDDAASARALLEEARATARNRGYALVLRACDALRPG